MQGTKEATSKEDAAYNLTTGTFSDVFSLYYGRKYFGEEAKQEVTQMVKDIKEVYRERMLKKRMAVRRNQAEGSQEAGYYETLYRLS